MNEFYTDYGEYLDRYFPGVKVQKISVNTGNGCPNRDGTIGTGGCIYCNNTSFTPSYCFKQKSITQQIEEGKNFFGKKYKSMRYLAYFQSYTSTYRSSSSQSVEKLRANFEEALSAEDIVGLVVGTRPDCIDDEIIKLLKAFNKTHTVFVELGIETLHDKTLHLVRRGHDSETGLNAIRKLSEAGLPVGVHLIAGLPGESREMILQTIKRVCRAGVESIKLHHLQVLRNTTLHSMIKNGEITFNPWLLDDYLDFCKQAIKIIPRTVAIERFLASAPPELVVAPHWGLKNYEFTNLLIKKLKEDE